MQFKTLHSKCVHVYCMCMRDLSRRITLTGEKVKLNWPTQTGRQLVGLKNAGKMERSVHSILSAKLKVPSETQTGRNKEGRVWCFSDKHTIFPPICSAFTAQTHWVTHAAVSRWLDLSFSALHISLLVWKETQPLRSMREIALMNFKSLKCSRCPVLIWPYGGDGCVGPTTASPAMCGTPWTP